MRTAGLLLLGVTPGVAVGYVVLLAYILNRVRPLPITFLPEFDDVDTADHREPLAA